MGWLIALGVLLGLAILPIGVSALYNADGACIRVIVGPAHITLFPRKKKGKKAEKVQKKEKQKPSGNKKQQTAKGGGSITDFLPFLRLVLDFLNSFRGKLRVKHLQMKLILAGDDPCNLAINYGRAWAALGALMPQLERFFVIRKRDLEVECDFVSLQTSITARLDLTITVGRLLSLAVRYGVLAVREYLNIMKLRKGGAKI